MKKEMDFAKRLIDFCYSSPTAFHAVETMSELLEASKFKRINEADIWELKPGGRYYLIRNDSALIAFIVGSKPPAQGGFRIVGTHIDSPGFRIKPSPEMTSEGQYLRLNTGVYGGPLLSTWFDRPLSIAGRVSLGSDNIFCPEIRLINIDRPIGIIPNMAIHMNPEANTTFAPNRQIDTIPLLAMLNEELEKKDFLVKLLARELKVEESEILDFDLFLYEFERGCITGLNGEFISCGHIDDLSSTHAGITALCDSDEPEATAVIVCFDNEEIGSSTAQGADSQILAEVLERIILAIGDGRIDYFRALANSFLISADGTHAAHPNHGEKCDLTSRPVINKGLAIKVSASKSYTTDASTSATFQMLCRKAKVKTQHFANRSDMRGGSTIGPISSRHLSIRSVDIGLPMLAMHSIRELCGVQDHHDMLKVLTEYFQS